MESSLLEIEDGYYKENEKLEMKTKELLKKVNDVMKIQDNLIKETFKSKQDLTVVKFSNASIPRSDAELSCEDLNVPKSVENMGAKGMNHFYRAKIKSLESELAKLQSDLKRKNDECRKIKKENENLQVEKEKWFSFSTGQKSNVHKLESQIANLTSKLQSKDGEMFALKRELEQLKKDVKSSNTSISSLEVRLNRSVEDNEKLKMELKESKENEKDLKENYRKQISDLEKTVSYIQKHKSDLLQGFKKQMQLIDNFKKQKMLLESLKIAEISDTEYLKILDWDLK